MLLVRRPVLFLDAQELEEMHGSARARIDESLSSKASAESVVGESGSSESSDVSPEAKA